MSGPSMPPSSPAHVPRPVIPPDEGFMSSLPSEFLKPPHSMVTVLYFTRKTESTSRDCHVPYGLIYSGPFSPTGRKQDSWSSQSQPQAQPSCLTEPLLDPPLLLQTHPPRVPWLYKQAIYFILKIMHRKMLGMTLAKLLPRK